MGRRLRANPLLETELQMARVSESLDGLQDDDARAVELRAQLHGLAIYRLRLAARMADDTREIPLATVERLLGGHGR